MLYNKRALHVALLLLLALGAGCIEPGAADRPSPTEGSRRSVTGATSMPGSPGVNDSGPTQGVDSGVGPGAPNTGNDEASLRPIEEETSPPSEPTSVAYIASAGNSIVMALRSKEEGFQAEFGALDFNLIPRYLSLNERQTLLGISFANAARVVVLDSDSGDEVGSYPLPNLPSSSQLNEQQNRYPSGIAFSDNFIYVGDATDSRSYVHRIDIKSGRVATSTLIKRRDRSVEVCSARGGPVVITADSAVFLWDSDDDVPQKLLDWDVPISSTVCHRSGIFVGSGASAEILRVRRDGSHSSLVYTGDGVASFGVRSLPGGRLEMVVSDLDQGVFLCSLSVSDVESFGCDRDSSREHNLASLPPLDGIEFFDNRIIGFSHSRSRVVFLHSDSGTNWRLESETEVSYPTGLTVGSSDR